LLGLLTVVTHDALVLEEVVEVVSKELCALQLVVHDKVVECSVDVWIGLIGLGELSAVVNRGKLPMQLFQQLSELKFFTLNLLGEGVDLSLEVCLELVWKLSYIKLRSRWQFNHLTAEILVHLPIGVHEDAELQER
jgi:hypothetical protein